MNPNQGPGVIPPGGQSSPPNPPGAPPVFDISEDAFGFTDDRPKPEIIQPVVRPAPQSQPLPARPAPPIAPPAPRPTATITQRASSQPVPPVAVQPPQPNPPIPNPVPDIMPPRAVPTVPALAPPTATVPSPPVVARPLTPPTIQPTPPPPPAAPSQPIKLGADFDPRAVPVHASSTSENPITATFSPAQTTHLPEDIAKRIAEHPIQNSDEVLRLAKHGFDLRRLKGIVSFLFFTAGIFIAAFLINQFIFQSYYVEGSSMTPTLQNNDRLIISKVERTLSAIQGQPYIPARGQIVVLDSSIVGINGQKEQLIKRVIGLPGDHIHIESGVVTITNSQHPDGYDVTKDLGLTNLQPTFTETPIDLIIPAGHVYVMGDNREQGGSYDSRAFGPIDGNKIQGRLWGRILPFDKAQLF